MASIGLPDILEILEAPQDWLQDYPLHTWYRGKIEDVDDPERRGRVRVRVESVWKSTPPEPNDETRPIPREQLPWADIVMHNQGDKFGTFWVPPVGTSVIVVFEMGQENLPLVIGGWWGNDATNLPEIPLAALGAGGDTAASLKGGDSAQGAGNVEIQEPPNPYAAEYPKNIVFRTPSGHLIELDDTDGQERINIAHKSGTWIEIHPDGTLVTGVQNKRYTVVKGDDELHVTGDKDTVVDGSGSLSTTGDYDQECANYGLLATGQLTAEATGQALIKGQTIREEALGNIDIVSPAFTNIGPAIASGPVVTTVTHPFDFITGLPISGVTNVLAG